jgi:hypothetical protein
MIATSFDESNKVFDKPPNMENCDALSVWVGTTPENEPIVISCFKCTKEELDEINRTGRVWVFHYGLSLQPHALVGTNPFK